MSKPPSALASALMGRCPRCRTGTFFTHGPLNLAHLAQHHTHCPHCGVQFEPEPGFFWGAMYFNYAFVVAVFLVSYVSLELTMHRPPLWLEIGVFLGSVALLLPLFVRAGRILMLHLFAGHTYDPRAAERPRA